MGFLSGLFKVGIPYMGDQLKQMADYLVKVKGYPGSSKEIFADLKEAFDYARKHGDVK